MFAGGIEQPHQERRGAAHLHLGIQPFQAEHGRDAMFADPRGDPPDLRLAILRTVDHGMAVAIGQRHEIAFGIDHHLLHPGGSTFEQPAQEMRFARAAVALHQQARGEQFLEFQHHRRTAGAGSHIDADGHAGVFAGIVLSRQGGAAMRRCNNSR